MDGILNINKPGGMTSFGVVARVRRLSGERRVGHGGTLDPMASGVLPVCLGQGTRVSEFLIDTAKVYRAEIKLGVATDTYDASGRVTQTGDSSGVGLRQLESALVSFCGLIEQTPPMYSALKYRGKPLYELARVGIIVAREARPAKIYRLEIVEWQPPVVTIEVVCGKGTYIRSLAHDLGQVLGCGASLKGLIRLRCGLFDIDETVSLSQLEHAFQHGYWQHFVYPVDFVLSHWTAMVVSDATGQAIKNGRPVVFENGFKGNGCREQYPLAPVSVKDYCRVYTPDGCFLGVLRFDAERGQWQTKKVFC